MIELELFGASLVAVEDARRLCTDAAARLGVEDGHVAIEFVGEQRIAQLNTEYRHKPEPTDVLSFPIDGIEALGGAEELDGNGSGGATPGTGVPRELGDIVICPAHTVDLREAIVHGMLHLLGMDHERDDGEMLALQRELLAGATR
jgi:probable rRNA maturation factor